VAMSDDVSLSLLGVASLLSRAGAKHDYLIASGALGGDVARLLKRVPKEVAMSALPRA
jgi:hypothetical protein